MKANQLACETIDRNGNHVTYGSDRHGPWLEFRDRRDRTAIYGNCRTNLERMRREITGRGIVVPAAHMPLFAEPIQLAA
jgi:hypothetical protein